MASVTQGGTAAPPVRDRILEAAVADLGAHGYTGASLERVAAAAGVTKPMVHYYFGSKSGLYEHALAWARGRLTGAGREAMASTAGAREVLASVVTALARRPSELSLVARAPEVEASGEGLRTSPLAALLLAIVGPVLERAAREGEARGCDGEVVAALLAAGLAVGGGQAERTAWGRRVVEQIWRGIEAA